MSLLPVGISGEEAGYQIERSLRFNSADSAYLNRTPASAGNRKTWTWSGWVKRSTLGSLQAIFSCGTNGVTYHDMYINSDDTLRVVANISGTPLKYTTQVFRDVGAWYHIVNVFDTTNATAGDRWRLYVNGVRITAFGTSTDPSLNADGLINSNSYSHAIGQRVFSGSNYLGGYLTEIHFVDGSALDPTSFGEYNEDTGVWQPKEYTGSYGTNGFYLNFSDNSGVTSTTLGADSSGNGNNWTPNNFSVTAGAGNDSLVDTPTNYGTDTGVGGEVRGNYATWNGVAIGADATLTNGNLDIAYGSATTRQATAATIGVSSGKWYWEVRLNASSITNSVLSIGIAKSATPNEIGTYVGEKATDYGYYGNDGTKFNNGSSTAYGASYAPGDVLGFALDMDAGTCVVYKNNTSQGTLASGLTGTYFPAISDATPTNTSSASANFGQRPFSYAAPTGFKALCTQNLPEPTIVDGGQYFNTVLYTGDDSGSRSITGVGFQPDLVWIKSRSLAYAHNLGDSVRGVEKTLSSNSTGAENYAGTGDITAFNADGFSIRETSNWEINNNGSTYVAWNWKANGAGVTNTAGTITSTVSANTDSGFSIVTYTGTGANATVGHGLGVTPKMVIVKCRSNAISSPAWPVWHTTIPASNYLDLQTTIASSTASSVWNSTLPTSSVFSIGTTSSCNSSGFTYVAYCFAQIPGYSAFGSYTGNGSADGPFVYTGFRPAYVLVKMSSSTGDWYIFDDARDPYNATQLGLLANTLQADGTYTGWGDFLSNGFKIRRTDAAWNTNGGTYIYAAFAENPFKYALAR